MSLDTHRAPDAELERPTVPSDATRSPWWRRPEPIVALVGFVAFAVVVLLRASSMLEPDDYAYRASIVALSHGQILLTNAQYLALQHQLASTGGQGIMQWHHMASGKWISEKNPGYPFFAVIFYMIGLLRLAPIFYGALACIGLYVGAKAWLGRWAGAFVVWIYCFSGASLVFAWRATMPTFTDASLIAAGFGALLWTMLRTDAPAHRRLLVGLAGFVAIECAVFIRYTNVVELFVALIAVLALRPFANVAWRTLALWLGSVVAFAAVVLSFNEWAYGHATSTGYSAGEITFSWSSFWPNLEGMPSRLATSMPMWIVALAALVWIGVNVVRHRNSEQCADARRDAVVAAVLAAGWLGIWFLYLNYTWTANMFGGAAGGPGGSGSVVHVIRFYLPALGLIALLATWLIVRVPRVIGWLGVSALVLAAVISFNSMASTSAAGGPGIGGGVHGTAPVGGGAYGQPPVGSTPPKGGGPSEGPPGGADQIPG
jgi:hypothetical protein